MISRKRPAPEPASPPRSNKQRRLSSPQSQKADLSQQPNEMKSILALANSCWRIFSTWYWPQPPTKEENSLIPPVSPSSQQSTEDEGSVEVACEFHPSTPPSPQQPTEDEDSVEVACDFHPSAPPSPQKPTEDEKNIADEKEVEEYLKKDLTSPERPRLESHGSTSRNNHVTLDEGFPISYHGSGGGSQSTPKRPNKPSSFITTTRSNTRPSFNIDHLAENVDNIRLDSSNSSLQSSQFTSSSFSRGSTVQSRETSSIFRKIRVGPRSKPHIHERKFKVSVREQNREALKSRMYEVKKHHRELVDGRLVKGAMNFTDFQLLLRGLGVDKAIHSRIIRGKSPRMSRHYFESGYRIKRTIDNAKATLNSPKPTVFTPSAEQRRLLDRIKDAAIEARLRGFPDNLPPKEEKEVDAILRKRGVVAKFAREQVSDVDVARLCPGQWLNDEIINFYGSMILARSEANKENAQVIGNGCGNGSLDVHYFSTFFWAKLCKDGYELGRLAKWTKKINIFLKDVILIPINHSNAHWTAAAINFRKKRIESYDSMGVAKRVVFTHLRAYLDAEHRDKKKKPFDFTGWEDFAPDNTPEQANGWDCGVFTCHFLEAISRGEQEFAFSQSHMPYLRRRMIWEIGNATLRKADYK